jgi:fluoroacetyl-CoA thioesterase
VPGDVPGLAAGLRATVRAAVTDADTAEAMGSGNLPVLATPRLLALAEAATVAAVAPNLTDGLTTVGTAVSLEHRKASPLGAEVVVEAELTEVDGRRLVFGFIARPTPMRTAPMPTAPMPTGPMRTWSSAQARSSASSSTGRASSPGRRRIPDHRATSHGLQSFGVHI